MTSTPIPCLGVGLRRSGSIPGASNTILDAEAAIGRSRGLEVSWCTLDLASDPVDKVLAEFRAALEVRKYAAVSIGNGVRGNKDYTVAFERMVNLCIEMQPGAKLGFAVWPDDVVNACERALGRDEKEV